MIDTGGILFTRVQRELDAQARQDAKEERIYESLVTDPDWIYDALESHAGNREVAADVMESMRSRSAVTDARIVDMLCLIVHQAALAEIDAKLKDEAERDAERDL